ncbi:AraC family transcriptional regulator [Paenibacillus mendelii]|uniref:Helix-turn-helix domain-containing protein n=1 Tax=Paenibacillus mendelii TaxID=206163 RepID=A0ABV6JI03_9BACL|nr:AraC family transcriptional regulator [Paenibacillus mendelii]MCQ6558413.1 AraC family transcriptional regulator [Paenibacillus mendelii]
MRRYTNEEFMDDDSFPFRAFPAPVSESIESHSHEFVELVFVVEGKGEHEYNHHFSPITEGDVYMISPQTTHGYRLQTDSPILVYNVIFQPSVFAGELEVMSRFNSFIDFFYIEPFLRSTASHRPHLNLKGRERLELKQMIERLIEEDRKREMGYQFFIKTAMIQLFIHLSRCYDRMLHKVSFAAAEEETMFRHVREFIAAHYAQPLTLKQLSGLCGMSQSSFTSKFKQYSGKTFIEYRNEIRIEVAKEWLTKTDEKTVAIALEVGYEDLSFFNRVFKDYFGMPPGKYRELFRGK